MKKYELTEEKKRQCGRTLHRIKALKDFADIKAGDLGGWIEKEENLSQDGNAWIYDNAAVCDNAAVYDNAQVRDNAWVYNDAQVYGNVLVNGDTQVYDDALVCGNAWVDGDAQVYDNAKVMGSARVYDRAWIHGDAKVYGIAHIYNDANIKDDAEIHGNVKVNGSAEICGDADISNREDYVMVKGFGSVCRTTTFFRLKDGDVGVQCGCFYGTLDEFREKVKSTYPNDKKGREYLMLADLMECRFKQE